MLEYLNKMSVVFLIYVTLPEEGKWHRPSQNLKYHNSFCQNVLEKKSLHTLKPRLKLTCLTEKASIILVLKASIILVLSEVLSCERVFLSCLFCLYVLFPTMLGLLIPSNYEENNMINIISLIQQQKCVFVVFNLYSLKSKHQQQLQKNKQKYSCKI